MRGLRFVEAEWNGQGKYPGAEKTVRGTMNEKQRKAVDAVFQSLEQVLNEPAKHGEAACCGTGIFAKDEWADVRWNVLIHPDCPHRLAAKLAITKLHAMSETIKSWHPDIRQLSGSFVVAAKHNITAPALTKSGSVDVLQGATFTAPALTEVSGSVDVQQGATFTAPALTEVSGSVYVREGATFTAPALTEVSGSVDVQQGATFTAPALTEVSGSVYVREGATFTAPALTEVSGSVDVREGATFTAPALTEVSGSVDVQQGATFTAPALAKTKKGVTQ
jgi:DUF4097 and DUF4098 domain-containing protein YvlB